MGYTQDLVAHWDLSTDNPPDICWRGNRYPGTGVGLVGHPSGIAGGICTEFSGGNNSYVNVGDVVEMNAVEKFSVALWMNQDILDQVDLLFKKSGGGAVIQLVATTQLYFECLYTTSEHPYARLLNYGSYIPAGGWHHVVVVFDGSGATNADRVKMYVDGNLMVLGFTAVFLAVTPNPSGGDLYLGGFTANCFDGKLDEFMIFDAALTQLQIADLYNRTRQGRF